MGKYEPLGKYLSSQTADSCTLTFSDVEAIVGGCLPASARAHQGWWGNDKTHVQARTWMRAGWKVTQHHLLRRGHVHFTRIVHDTLSDESPRVSQVIVRNLDERIVAELKRRAKQRGALSRRRVESHSDRGRTPAANGTHRGGRPRPGHDARPP